MATPSCRVAIKATPNASRNEVCGWLNDTLKVKIKAPALEGRANEALCEFLAEKVGLPRRAVNLIRGETSRQKLVELTGISLDEVRSRLDQRQS
ncbi:MAG TPA: DUF167 domain-containing protein [Opitutaceae bacterium]|nr:DUF167 domain-containing protein [Opitutaceae bacterium]